MQSQRGLQLAVLDEVNAAIQTATHKDVCPLAQAQRLDFRHRLVGGKLAEEKEVLRVGQVRPRLGEGYIEKCFHTAKVRKHLYGGKAKIIL